MPVLLPNFVWSSFLLFSCFIVQSHLLMIKGACFGGEKFTPFNFKIITQLSTMKLHRAKKSLYKVVKHSRKYNHHISPLIVRSCFVVQSCITVFKCIMVQKERGMKLFQNIHFSLNNEPRWTSWHLGEVWRFKCSCQNESFRVNYFVILSIMELTLLPDLDIW